MVKSNYTKAIYYWAAGVLVMLFAIGVVVWGVVPRGGKQLAVPPTPRPVPDTDATKDSTDFKQTIAGRPVAVSIAGRIPVAVMVENHPDARPQTGLSQAEVIYEMVAEGGITRYLALFQADVKSVGPVRSAREYYAELADGFGAGYAHVGGSPAALKNLERGVYKNTVDINEYFQGGLFERIKSRAAPHNVYALMPKLYEFTSSRKSDVAYAASAFAFSDSVAAPAEPASNITINFSTASYKAEFVYDPVTKTYKRMLAGKKDVDALSKEQLAPTTVVVQLTDISQIPGDDKERMDIRTTGSGKVYVFQNGGVVTGTWKREPGKPTQYFDMQNKSTSFTPGQIWIALVSKKDPNALVYQ